jgi:hypothetical protein
MYETNRTCRSYRRHVLQMMVGLRKRLARERREQRIVEQSEQLLTNGGGAAYTTRKRVKQSKT